MTLRLLKTGSYLPNSKKVISSFRTFFHEIRVLNESCFDRIGMLIHQHDKPISFLFIRKE